MSTVLITGARAPIALDLARSFAAAGFTPHLADSIRPWSARLSRTARGRLHRLAPPRFSFAAFTADLGALVKRLEPVLIVPTCEEVFYVAEAAARLGLSDRVFAPSPTILRLLHSKVEFAELARGCGVAAPATRRAASAQDLDPWRPLAARLVFKPEFSRFASHALVRPDAKTLARVVPTPDAPWAIQDFAAGEELCLWSAAIKGQVVAFAAYRPLWRLGRSASFYFETDKDPALLAFAQTIAGATGASGQLSFDVIRTADGTIVPLECNPRGISGLHLFDSDPRLARAIMGQGGLAATDSARAAPCASHVAAGRASGPHPGTAWPFQQRPEAQPRCARHLRRALARPGRPARRRTFHHGGIEPRPLRLWPEHRRYRMERRGDRMSLAELFEPARGPCGGWPAGTEAERTYIEAFAAAGAPALIANLHTRVLGLRQGERIFPITVNEAEYGDAYVCLPHTAYALYARAELRIVDAGPWTPALGLLASASGGVMRAARLNRIVHVNNWMLSTNLQGGWTGEGLDEIRDLLVRRFPDHLIAIRSLNAWSDPALIERFKTDGWILLPSRQIYVTGDLDRDWAPRRDTRRDLALMAATPYRIDDLQTLQPGDAERIAALYAMLYLDRYSALNPAFTPAYIAMTHRARIFSYRGLRNAEGVLAAVVGCFVRGGVLTTPIVGYDTARPAADGLYRLASVMLAEMTRERGLRLNGSAGAASFKVNRGARPVIEYSAWFVDHLSWPRRAVVAGMEALLNRLAVPLMEERGL